MKNCTTLVGSKFGRLTVIAKQEQRVRRKIQWLCRCDCGEFSVSDSYRLTSGKHKSCGCLRSEVVSAKNIVNKNLIGKTFGNLAVTAQGPDVTDKRGKVNRTWLCVCKCGRDSYVATNALMTGNTKSCGCGRFSGRTRSDKKLQIPTSSLIRSIKRRATERGISWDISEDAVKKALASDCTYCGSAPRFYARDGVTRNGIDRLDNDLGYTVDNSIPCCTVCNQMKGTFSFTEFSRKISDIYINLGLSSTVCK